MDMGAVVAAGGATSFLAGLSVMPLEPITGMTLAASGLSAMMTSNKVGSGGVVKGLKAEREAHANELSVIRERTTAMEKEVEYHRNMMQQVQTTLLWSAITCGASVAILMWSRSRGRSLQAGLRRNSVAAAAAPPAMPEAVVQGIVVHPDAGEPQDLVASLRLSLQDFHRSDGELVEASESRERAGLEYEQQRQWDEVLRRVAAIESSHPVSTSTSGT